MHKYVFFILTAICLCASCSKKNDTGITGASDNKVLMLKVDYLTNTFEGGTETVFPNTTSGFTLSTIYKAPGDFGYIKIRYKELDTLLFDGDIIWAGLGRMHFPQNILPADQFEKVTTTDYVNPGAGFENIFNPGNLTIDYAPVWSSVQGLVKVREYLKTNPNATIKLFLYTPSVGAGNPADADWIVFIKN